MLGDLAFEIWFVCDLEDGILALRHSALAIRLAVEAKVWYMI